MTDRSTATGIRRVEMTAILNVLKPLDASSCATSDRKRRLIASVCRLIGDELMMTTGRDGGSLNRAAAALHASANGHDAAGAPSAVPARRHTGAPDAAAAADIARVRAPHLLLQLDAVNGGQLSPRLQQTLQSLLDGDSEKQVARRLGLSPHTVHVYVKKLYRRYGVSSRGELLSKWVAR